MRRPALALWILLAALLVGPVSARADTEGWHSEQPVAAGIGLQESLGEVGDIAFWSPDRGVLISGGVGGMPAGVYAYDGVEWHLYSTVCGGHSGSIAWEGPESFWTVSDQPVGQEGILGGESSFRTRWNRSLCHFVGGKVVASYAEPLGAASSYPHLNAAACRPGFAECWFGGERLPGSVNVGAFHLRLERELDHLIPVPDRTAGGRRPRPHRLRPRLLRRQSLRERHRRSRRRHRRR